MRGDAAAYANAPPLTSHSQIERQLSVHEAAGVALVEAIQRDFTVSLRRLSGDGQVDTVACELSMPGIERREAGLGKGIGAQSTASAIFEALEHAACHGKIINTSTIEWADRAGYSTPACVRGALQDYFESATSGDQSIAVTPFRRMGEGLATEEVHNPSAYSDMSFRAAGLAGTRPEKLVSAYVSSNGYAAGWGVVEAELHALNEVLERDAFGSFLARNLVGRSPIEEVDYSESAPLLSLRGMLEERHEAAIRVGRLESMAGNVFVATAGRFDSDGSLLVGLGSSADVEYAIERSLLELDQELTSVRLGLDPTIDGALNLRESLGYHPNLLRIALLEGDIPFDRTFHPRFDVMRRPPAEELLARCCGT